MVAFKDFDKPASAGEFGLAYTEFKGNPASPGMSNFVIARLYISCIPWFLFAQRWSFLRHSVMYNVI